MYSTGAAAGGIMSACACSSCYNNRLIVKEVQYCSHQNGGGCSQLVVGSDFNYIPKVTKPDVM